MTRSQFCKCPYRIKVLSQYHKNVRSPPTEPYYDPSFDEIDRIIGLHLCKLNRSVTKIRLRTRAILRWLIQATKDLTLFSYAISLLDGVNSVDFDPTFENREVAEAVDAEFMKQLVMILPEFSHIKGTSSRWVRRLELVALVTFAMEQANHNISDIYAPKLSDYLPVDWWTEQDDRCLM
jgi:hypothetical protein